MRLVLAVLVCFGFFAVMVAGPAVAAPKADLWPDWQAHDAQSTEVIDHSAWQSVLDDYLVVTAPGASSFDYGRATSDGGAARVDAYVTMLTNIAIDDFNRDQQMAYWINLYNALTVKVVLDHYPVDSIRDIDISPGLFSSGPWGKKLITVEGRTLSLDDIEHRILRPIWRDARIHYVVNCASIGCPALAEVAFDAENLEAQLDQAAKDFINHPRAVRRNQDGEWVLSSLYDWYRDDFGKRDVDFIDHLKRFAGQDLLNLLGDRQSLDVGDYEYDWALNAPAR
ncbi:MAG: DUF547 domain-containing protein [Thalassospira sp.]|uniref:DUF547 domain-containing protein n=1 Tax=Thalassospira sp. TaxID=1912094 RepID=UPI003A8A13BD